MVQKLAVLIQVLEFRVIAFGHCKNAQTENPSGGFSYYSSIEHLTPVGGPTHTSKNNVRLLSAFTGQRVKNVHQGHRFGVRVHCYTLLYANTSMCCGPRCPAEHVDVAVRSTRYSNLSLSRTFAVARTSPRATQNQRGFFEVKTLGNETRKRPQQSNQVKSSQGSRAHRPGPRNALPYPATGTPSQGSVGVFRHFRFHSRSLVTPRPSGHCCFPK